eukprot:12197955-Prorocentrum_lima.AAC.1
MCDLRPDFDHMANDQTSSCAGLYTPAPSSTTSKSASGTVRSMYRPVRAQPVLNCTWRAKAARKVRAGVHPLLPKVGARSRAKDILARNIHKAVTSLQGTTRRLLQTLKGV